MNNLAVIIVTHNNVQVIGPCLEAVSRDRAISQVVVVDSASTDNTVAAVQAVAPRATLLRCKQNVGFGTACNIGAREAAPCDWLLFLNPDTVAQPGAISRLLAAAHQEGTDLAGGKLVNPDGTPQIGYIARRLPRPSYLIAQCLLLYSMWPVNPLAREHLCMDLDFGTRQQFEHPTGALLLVSRQAFEQLGGFDEAFYLSFEDADFCRRARDSGLKAIYEPSAVVFHVGGVSFKQQSATFNRPLWFASVLMYGNKHFDAVGRIALRAAAAVGAVVRAGLSLIRPRSATGLGGRLAESTAYLACGWRAAVGTLTDSMPRPGREFER